MSVRCRCEAGARPARSDMLLARPPQGAMPARSGMLLARSPQGAMPTECLGGLRLKAVTRFSFFQ